MRVLMPVEIEPELAVDEVEVLIEPEEPAISRAVTPQISPALQAALIGLCRKK